MSPPLICADLTLPTNHRRAEVRIAPATPPNFHLSSVASLPSLVSLPPSTLRLFVSCFCDSFGPAVTPSLAFSSRTIHSARPLFLLAADASGTQTHVPHGKFAMMIRSLPSIPRIHEFGSSTIRSFPPTSRPRLPAIVSEWFAMQSTNALVSPPCVCEHVA